jgi:hypothetical protein
MLMEAREIACGRESVVSAEKVRIAHGGMVGRARIFMRWFLERWVVE